MGTPFSALAPGSVARSLVPAAPGCRGRSGAPHAARPALSGTSAPGIRRAADSTGTCCRPGEDRQEQEQDGALQTPSKPPVQPRALLPSDSPLRHGFSLCPLASTLPLPTLGPPSATLPLLLLPIALFAGGGAQVLALLQLFPRRLQHVPLDRRGQFGNERGHQPDTRAFQRAGRHTQCTGLQRRRARVGQSTLLVPDGRARHLCPCS